VKGNYWVIFNIYRLVVTLGIAASFDHGVCAESENPRSEPDQEVTRNLSEDFKKHLISAEQLILMKQRLAVNVVYTAVAQPLQTADQEALFRKRSSQEETARDELQQILRSVGERKDHLEATILFRERLRQLNPEWFPTTQRKDQFDRHISAKLDRVNDPQASEILEVLQDLHQECRSIDSLILQKLRLMELNKELLNQGKNP